MIAFHVLGVPRPQGSKRAFVRGGRPVLVEAGGAAHKSWRHTVTCAAHEAAEGFQFAARAPVQLTLTFTFARPKSHYTPKGKLRRGAPSTHTQRPDVDKLVRAVCDSLTDAGVIHDDAQISAIDALKQWGARPGATIELSGGTVT